MALSNIFREPRREITESAVGIALFAPFAYGDYRFADWFATAVTPPPYIAGLLLGMGLGVAALALAWVFLCVVASVTHRLGEAVCDTLQDHGIHLRPKQRRQ